jgi:hypothetical protein
MIVDESAHKPGRQITKNEQQTICDPDTQTIPHWAFDPLTAIVASVRRPL